MAMTRFKCLTPINVGFSDSAFPNRLQAPTIFEKVAMSKSALSFLILALMAVIVDMLLPVQAHAMSIAANICAGVFASLFVVALFVGRRFKFDPVLR